MKTRSQTRSETQSQTRRQTRSQTRAASSPDSPVRTTKEGNGPSASFRQEGQRRAKTAQRVKSPQVNHAASQDSGERQAPTLPLNIEAVLAPPSQSRNHGSTVQVEGPLEQVYQDDNSTASNRHAVSVPPRNHNGGNSSSTSTSISILINNMEFTFIDHPNRYKLLQPLAQSAIFITTARHLRPDLSPQKSNIYVITFTDPNGYGLFKVGRSSCPPTRANQHGSCYGPVKTIYPLTVEDKIPVAYACLVEQLIHAKLAPYAKKLLECPKRSDNHLNGHGEWFQAPEAVVLAATKGTIRETNALALTPQPTSSDVCSLAQAISDLSLDA